MNKNHSDYFLHHKHVKQIFNDPICGVYWTKKTYTPKYWLKKQKKAASCRYVFFLLVSQNLATLFFNILNLCNESDQHEDFG